MFEFTISAESAPQAPRSLAASVLAHTVVILLLFAIRFSAVSKSPAAPDRFILIAPAREMPIGIPKVQAPRPREFRPLPPAPAHLELPAAVIPPPIEIPKPVIPEIPRAAPVAVSVPVIKPSAFGEVQPAAVVQAPKPVVKAVGFESSETSAAGPPRGALSALGSFESAHSSEGVPVRSAVAHPGGFSDASAPSSILVRQKTVAIAAFGDTTVEKGVPGPRQTAVAPRLTPVEILSKPKPAFTNEARTKNIEGEVLLEVRFNASGDVRVLRVIRGLGHGLDETAVAAALGIRFRPATRDGAAVDSSALLHIVFQLAN